MSERVTIDPAFEITIPDGWSAEADEEGGISAGSETGSGLLHLIAFPQPTDEPLDPAEELYVFLEDQGIELEEDEIEDLDLPDAELAVCEYTAAEEEEDEDEGDTYWMVAVATAPGTLVFCNFSCPAADAEREREPVLEILRSLRLRPAH